MSMKKFITWSFCLLFCGSLIAQDAAGNKPPAAAADAPATRLVIELSDGSRITGVPAVDRLKITTGYGEMVVLLSRLRTFAFDPATRTAVIGLQNDDHLEGKVADTEITLNTIVGPVVVPMSHVRQIRSGPSNEQMPDGLVLHYSFDTDEGGRVTDSSGERNHGKVHGAKFTSQGKIFGAMSFSGDGDAVIVGNPDSLHLQNFTIMAWIKRGALDKVSKTTEYGEIFGYGAGGYVMGINQEGSIYLSQTDIHFGSNSSFTIHDKDFHHVAVTKDGNKFVFYLDGVAYPGDDFETEGDFVFNTDAAVGARSDDLHKCFIGVIDEVAVFKRPLSADEIKKVYESQK